MARCFFLSIAVLLAGAGALQAQTRGPRLPGTWRAQTPDGPEQVVIRPDSSASWGSETVRWRLVKDSIFIAFGDEWMVYKIDLRGDRITVSGGDLEEPITLRRVGPPTPRPDSIPLPPEPPLSRRATNQGD